MKCEQIKVIPCLLLKKENTGRVILLIVCYVDEVLLSVPQNKIEKFKRQFKENYNITEFSGKMKTPLGTWYEWKWNENNEHYIHVTIDSMLKDIAQTYEKIVEKKV